jgi:hypothetical protein
VLTDGGARMSQKHFRTTFVLGMCDVRMVSCRSQHVSAEPNVHCTMPHRLHSSGRSRHPLELNHPRIL